tara:strand:+ start:183 stop:2360 length:2178 start_codon:yes stop_codon:yes gene_type:complete
MTKEVGGVDFVRPPMLDIQLQEETKDYKEYEVKTFQYPKDQDSTSISESTHIFTRVTDSLVFCNPTLRLKMPKPSFMKRKDGTHKFAYAFGMFPYPKTGKAAYLDGCILGALGLKRQGVHADVVCFVTPDIDLQDRMKLATVFDKVIRVPYISPYEMPDDNDESLQTILMDPEIFKNCRNYTKMHPYAHVFFKLHIFNPDLFPYEKVCFVDSDLVPMNYYDSLFMLNTPAGWVEYRKKWPYKVAFSWDRCDYLQHGHPIPKIFTDVDTPGGSDVNAGLMVVSPNKREYNAMIKEITSPAKDWIGPDKFHKGFYDFELTGKDPVGKQFIDSSYCYPEQNYLTKRYSGKWTYIEFAFQSWSLDPCNSFGIHMAAFNPKPWFKQPAGNEIKFSSRPQPYVKLFEDESIQAPVGIPNAFVLEGDFVNEGLNFENISVSYEMFNDVIVWGLVTYPDLHTFFLENTQVHGSKISFDKDKFKPLSKDHPFLKFKDIKRNSSIYRRLTMSQKYICNLLQDYEKFSPQIKDKFTSVCKTKFMDRYGNYVANFAIITYPNVTDIHQTEESILLDEKRMPFGKFKGKPIKQMDEEYIRKFISKRQFQKNKDMRRTFRKTKFRSLLQSEEEYKQLELKTGTKKTKRKRRSTKPVLMYFYMEGCKWCEKFQPIWKQVVRSYKSKLTMKKINGPENPTLVKQYKVTEYPTILLVKQDKPKRYKGKPTLAKLKQFLNKVS